MIHARTLVYAGVLAAVAAVMLGSFLLRSTLTLTVIRDRAPIFVRLSDGGVRNAYTLKLANKLRDHEDYVLDLQAPAGLAVLVQDAVLDSQARPLVASRADGITQWRALVTAAPGLHLAESVPVIFRLLDAQGRVMASTASVFLGPLPWVSGGARLRCVNGLMLDFPHIEPATRWTETIMHKDWPGMAASLAAPLKELRGGTPEVMQGFSAMARAALAPKTLDGKAKELIALGIAVAIRCDACITFHAEAALRQGDSRDEVMEVMGMAIYMGAGPAVMYAAQAVEAFDQYAAKAAG